MAGPHGPKKRTLRPGRRPKKPSTARAEIRAVISKSRIPEIPEIESLPESAAPAEIVVDSAPVPKAGGPGTGALPRSKKPMPAHVKAALARAEATSAGKEAPKVDEAGVDPALKAEFGEGAEEAKAETAAKAAELLEDMPARMGGADVYEIKYAGFESTYLPEYDAAAKDACLNGATDHDLADILRVSLRTIYRWKAAHVSFRQSIHLGTKEFRENQNDNVERGLYQRATGYIQRTEKVMQFKGKVMRVQQDEHVPADVAAAKHWLSNRRPTEWKVDPETGNVPGAAEALVGMQIMELARRMGMVLLAGAQAEEAIELQAETVSTE